MKLLDVQKAVERLRSRGYDIEERGSGVKKEYRVVEHDPVCDFCNAPEIFGTIDCPDFQMAVGVMSRGGWMSCKDCFALVESGEWSQLVARACESYLSAHPEDANLRQQLYAQMAADYKQIASLMRRPN